jgi:hypothetical protein
VASKGTLTVRALLDSREFARGLKDMGTKLDRQGRKLKDFGDKLSKRVSLPLAAGAVAAVKFASDLEQSVGAVESVFGPVSRRIFEFGETSADAFGLSRREVNETAAVLGAQLQGMGIDTDDAAGHVINLQQRAADMAATFGGTTSEALQAIGALMRGERDPIEKYGVSLKAVDVNARIAAEGMDTSTVEAEKQATAIASLDLLLEQTAKTQGQFGREAETTAGKLARAKAEAEDAAAAFGEQLLPVAADLLGVAGRLVKAFGAMPGPMKNTVAAAGLLAIAAGPVIRGFGSMASLGGSLVGKLRVLDKTTGKTSISLAKLGGMLGRGGLVGAGLVVATTLLGAWISAKERATERTQAFTAAIEADSGALEENTRKEVVNRLETEGLIEAARGLGIAQGDLANAVMDETSPAFERVNAILAEHESQNRANIAGVEGLDQRVRGVRGAVSGWNSELQGLVESNRRMREENDAATESVEKATTATDGWSRQLEGMRPVMDGWVGRAEDMADQLDDTGDEADTTKLKFHGLTEAIGRQQDALREQTDPAFRAQQSMERLQEAHDAASEAVERYGPKSKEAERANRDLAASAVAAKGDMLAFQAGIDDGTLSIAAYDAQMDQMVRDGILPADAAEAAKRHFREIKETAESIDGIDPQVTIRVAHLDALAALRAFDEQLARIPRNVTTTLGTRGRLEPKAHGGPVQAGRPYIVGEKRPELFVPGTSGRILPHVPRHAGGTAGGVTWTGNVIVQGSVTTERDLEEVVRSALVKVQGRNGTTGVL